MSLVGQWLRVDDALVIDERGWHRVLGVEELQGDVDGRCRLELCCHISVLLNPYAVERGLPGAGATVCGMCASWKEA